MSFLLWEMRHLPCLETMKMGMLQGYFKKKMVNIKPIPQYLWDEIICMKALSAIWKKVNRWN